MVGGHGFYWLEAIASRLEAIAASLEAIASIGWRPLLLLVGGHCFYWLEAMASRLVAVASRLERGLSHCSSEVLEGIYTLLLDAQPQNLSRTHPV